MKAHLGQLRASLSLAVALTCGALIVPGHAGTRIETGTSIIPPVGFIGFCVGHPHECALTERGEPVVELTDARLAELARVQADVNWSILPRKMQSPMWSYAVDGYGDCNTYALTKRKELVALGWSESALLLAAAYDEQGEGHLVLVVRTTEADLVLDNRLAAVVPWNSLPYRWIEIQSQESPARWVKIVDPRVLVAENQEKS